MAAGNIKGITIEIGGDTTKLSKALSGGKQLMQFFTKRIEGSGQVVKTRSLKYRAFGTKTKDSERSYRKYKRKVGIR